MSIAIQNLTSMTIMVVQIAGRNNIPPKKGYIKYLWQQNDEWVAEDNQMFCLT